MNKYELLMRRIKQARYLSGGRNETCTIPNDKVSMRA
jgi:hypothetical protein